jgi:predicted NBD/HSP70 family sugar kinase
VLGVDIGGTKTALLVWELTTGAVQAQDVFPTPTEIGPEAMVDRLVAAIDALLAGCGRERANLRGVGVAVPGLVDAEAGVVLTAGNLAGWSRVPLRDMIEA